jgi:hypothetical protein
MRDKKELNEKADPIRAFLDEADLHARMKRKILSSGSVNKIQINKTVRIPPETHFLDGADHSVSGLTTGTVLMATSPTTFDFSVIGTLLTDLDGGYPDSIYGSIDPIDGGGVT